MFASSKTGEARKADRPPRLMARPAGAPSAREAKKVGKVEIHIPLVTWRDGRPRYFASAVHRAMGYKGEDLRHGRAGAWFTLEECIAWSKVRQAELAQKRAAIASGESTAKDTARDIAKARAAGLVTISQVMETFRLSPRMQGREIVQGKKKRRPLSATTIRFYTGAIRCLENFEDGQWWHEPARDLTARVLDGLVDAIEQAHGLSQARAVRGVISVAFAHGRGQRLVDHNPVSDSDTTLPMKDPRVRPATVREFVAMLAAFDALGLPDAGDIFCAGAWTGQRLNDRRALMESQMTADGIVFAPHKKKAENQRLLIPVARVLGQRLEAARARRQAVKIARLRNDAPVFQWDAGGVAWSEGRYGKIYRMVRHAVATGGLPAIDGKTGKVDKEWQALFRGRDVAAELAAAGIAAVPSVADLRDQDLRDTCLSWLPLAGANKWEIAGFSGHAFAGRENVLGHYLAIDPEFARTGMAKLEAWFARQLADLEAKKVTA